MKALKVFGLALGGIVAVVLIVAVVAYVLMRSSSGIASEVKPVVVDKSAAQQFDAKVQAFEKAAQTSKPGTALTLTVTQEELTSKINEELSKADLPENMQVRDLTLNLVQGEVLASAKVSISGLQTTLGIRAKIEVVNGKPSIVVQDLDLGRLPLPQGTKDQIADLIPTGAIELSSVPVDIQDVQIVNGQLVIKGVTK